MMMKLLRVRQLSAAVVVEATTQIPTLNRYDLLAPS